MEDAHFLSGTATEEVRINGTATFCCYQVNMTVRKNEAKP